MNVVESGMAGPPERFDVFMSLAGPDRERVRGLVAAMRRRGLRVFYDEDMPEHHGITAEIESALHHSTALVAYYSRHYTSRTACQYELTRAFIAGQREGDPTRRIMVVNPHEETGHLAPAELADAKFDRLPAPGGTAAWSPVAGRIRAKVDGLTGRIGDLPVDRRVWHAHRVPGTRGFTGRYHELWALHSALVMHRFGLVHPSSSGGTCVLAGLPGMGKTALAAAYAWQFGAGHQGGVWWVSLAGSDADPDSLLATFAAELRELPALRTILPTAPAGDVVAAFAEHVAGLGEPSLLVIDDVPGEVTAEVLHRLAVPSVGDRLRTVLISNRAVPDGPAGTVEVGAMSTEDATGLLQAYRAGSSAEVTALAERLGHNPLALSLAGRLLRDRAGLLSYATLTERIDRDRATMAPVTALLRERIGALDTDALRLLHVAVVSSPAALPSVLIRLLLGDEAERVVEVLQGQLVVTGGEQGRQVHRLVRDAVRDFRPAADWTAVAAETAGALLGITDPDPLVVRHIAHLAGRTDLPPSVTEALHRRAVAHFDSRGEAILALPHHRALAARHPDDPAVQLAAARCLFACGMVAEAHDHAGRAGPEGRRIAADSLDALGRFDEAEPLWTALVSHPAAPPETVLAYLRSRRLRGRHDLAKRGLADLVARLRGEPFDLAQVAQLELARAEMETNGQVAARRRTAAVVEAYAERGLPEHVTAVEASRMAADAQLALALTDLKPDPERWREAARELERLRDLHARTHGPRNTLTLTLAVSHAEALIALGEPARARREVEAVHADVLDRFGPAHPTALRAEVVLGYAAAQTGEYALARDHFARAHRGLSDVFDARHPYCLRAEFSLAVAYKLTGDDAAARPLFAHVSRHSAGSVGIGTDLFWQSMFGPVLQVVPGSVWRRLMPRPKRP